MAENKDRVIFHIDVNSAYLSWTAIDMLAGGHPTDIRELPAAIAGDPKQRHGIILAKSMLAKRAGVRTGESIMEAKRKCPELQLFPPDHELYAHMSDKMFSLLYEYSDTIERFSVDECWMDYTGSAALMGDPIDTAYRLKERIKRDHGFTVNIGVSTNKLLAKMGSELEKPDKLHTLFPNEIEKKMWPLPVTELFFVGRSTAKKLYPLSIKTIGDLANADIGLLQTVLKPAQGKQAWEYANGIDDAPVIPSGTTKQKGIGHDTTTSHDVTDMEEAKLFLLSLADRVSTRLRKHGGRAWVVHVHIRRSDMTFSGKQRRLNRPIAATDEIYAEAVHLLGELWNGEPLRQFGISVTEFNDADNMQTSLFDADGKSKLESIDSAVDKIRETFGENAIVRGAFVNSKKESSD